MVMVVEEEEVDTEEVEADLATRRKRRSSPSAPPRPCP
jgi:hypothetical protein